MRLPEVLDPDEHQSHIITKETDVHQNLAVVAWTTSAMLDSASRGLTAGMDFKTDIIPGYQVCTVSTADINHSLRPIAVAVMNRGSKPAVLVFLEALTSALEQTGAALPAEVVIDRAKALIHGIPDVWPTTTIIFCTWHTRRDYRVLVVKLPV